MALTHFSLCTGGGGIDIAAEMAGFETVAQCEIDPYCNLVLESRFPGLPYWEDIHHVTAHKFSRKTGIAPGELTLLSAGIPCQPHSVAGARKGGADERDLKDEALRVISELRPKWCLVENVNGLLSSDDGRYFGDFLRQLAALGYDAFWCSFRASDVGAKHPRERIFIVADTERAGLQESRDTGIPGGAAGSASDGSTGTLEHTSGTRQLERYAAEITGKEGHASGGYDTFREQRKPESGLGGTFNGLADWLDSVGWVADKGQAKEGFAYAWEPPRTATGIKDRAKRLKMIGNGVCPQQVFIMVEAIADIENSVR